MTTPELALAPGPVRVLDPDRPPRARWIRWLPPVVAAVMVVVSVLLRTRGVDLPAALYRVALFHREGLTLWDSQWYGGHWTLNYSVIFAPLAGSLGLHVTAALSGALAALAFDRLVIGHFGPTARAGSIVFALGTLVQVAIGQLPFLMGEALALTALWAATKRWWPVAVVMAIGTALASPLAGAFLIMAAVAWMLAQWPTERRAILILIAAAALPVVLSGAVFPGQGMMPFPFKDFAAEGAMFVAALVFVPRRERVIRIALWLYLAAFVVSFLIRSPMGGNVERLGESVALPLAFCIVWPLRRLILPVMVVPLAIIQWAPAFGALTTNPTDPSTFEGYFTPVVSYLEAHDTPLGRVEVVPTELHYEAAYVAPDLPLARGWERQLDTADNPLFYTKGALTPATYYAWLVDNGVRFVALPDGSLDYAGVAEGALIRGGVLGLTEVWRSAHWRVFAVEGSPGLVSGPARAVTIDGGQISLDVTAPGTIEIRERYSARWAVVQGAGCTHEVTGGWLAIQALRPGPLRAELRLVGPSGDSC